MLTLGETGWRLRTVFCNFLINQKLFQIKNKKPLSTWEFLKYLLLLFRSTGNNLDIYFYFGDSQRTELEEWQ